MAAVLDELLPEWDVRSAHAVDIAAPPSVTDAAVRDLDLSRSWVCRLLFRLRGLPTRGLTLAGLERIRFVRIVDRPGVLVYALVGRFWRPAGPLLRFTPEQFDDLKPAGFARAVWAFVIEPTVDGCRAATETRVQACDERARRSFRRYWRVVGPFSGFIRREALRLLREDAEARARS